MLIWVAASLLSDSGVDSLMYLCNWLLTSPSAKEVRELTTKAVVTAESLGFKASCNKSTLLLTQSLEWIGKA